MLTTIAAAAVWQFEASLSAWKQSDSQNRFLYSIIIILIFLACYHVAKDEFFCAFVGAPVHSNMLNMPKSACGLSVASLTFWPLPLRATHLPYIFVGVAINWHIVYWLISFGLIWNVIQTPYVRDVTCRVITPPPYSRWNRLQFIIVIKYY